MYEKQRHFHNRFPYDAAYFWRHYNSVYCWFFLYAIFRKKGCMYMLPDGFKGMATVFFNDPSGKPEKRNGEKRIFEIPASGMLYTQSVYRKKWNNYYYMKQDGNVQQLMYGDARTEGGSCAYRELDSVWVQDINVKQRDTNDRKLTVAMITVKRTH